MDATQKFGMRLYWIALVAIVVLALFPLVSVLIVGVVADANGCVVNEAAIHPCVIGGVDWGGTLATMGILGWLMLATFPIGFVLFIVWIVSLVIHRIAWRRNQQKASGQ